MQILAATTNNIYGNQTFGITSGTLGCTQDGVVSSSAKLSMFTGSNMDRLARDMSQGEGESLATLADLMGIESTDKAAFYSASRENFDKIFASADVNANLSLNLKDIVGSSLWLEQVKAIGLTLVLAIVGTVILGFALKSTIGLRPTDEDEEIGLDITDHGERGYHT